MQRTKSDHTAAEGVKRSEFYLVAYVNGPASVDTITDIRIDGATVLRAEISDLQLRVGSVSPGVRVRILARGKQSQEPTHRHLSFKSREIGYSVIAKRWFSAPDMRSSYIVSSRNIILAKTLPHIPGKLRRSVERPGALKAIIAIEYRDKLPPYYYWVDEANRK